ncbi:hypothetical protein ABZS71_00565 [Streptomyces sp. NPDC005393]|uniref:hypothetical protein n=1 Tax=Streptomyces sp. NPDC005393 TaxID=3157041 RepID=UPI0033A6950C
MQRTEGDRQRRQHLADVSTGHTLRLLPWVTEDGKRCLLSTSDEGGFLSRLADDFEAVQLAVGEDVLKQARKALEDPMTPNAEVRYTAVRLSECLTDALRIAESRGLRLPAPDTSEDDDEDPATSAEAVE